LLTRAEFSFIAAAVSLKKISTEPHVTCAKTNGDFSGTVIPRSNPSRFS
jgi:hypothetical protein